VDQEVLSALIGTAAGVVLAIISSLVIPLFLKRQEKVEQRRSVHEKYAQPLAADAVNLLWRLDEILFKGRAQYLSEDAPKTPFNVYKRISTCYRIAAVLGWVRAIELEQSYLFFGEDTSVEDLRAAVVDLKSALADSPHVEAHVLRGLAETWGVPLPADPVGIARAAACGNAEMQHVLAEFGLVHYRELSRLDEARQTEVVRRMSAVLTAAFRRPPVDQAVLHATRTRALAHISVKQAWIYRDWQQAIGTLMIRTVDDAARRFDVLDYGTFERLFLDEQSDEKPWMERLEAVVVGVDPADPDPSDFRVTQLRAVAGASAALICAIERLDLERRILDPKACDLARRLLAEIPPRDVAAELTDP
jgi:hypothetical protein